MLNRIDQVFTNLKTHQQKALIPFIVAGDPDIDSTKNFVINLINGGADIIELGIPFSDPIADGPVIQSAAQRAQQSGTNITQIMNLVKELRINTTIPIVFLIYYNQILQYGLENFLLALDDADVDGIIVPDLPLEEREELFQLCNKYKIHLIAMVAPTSGDRIEKIVNGTQGFIYCVSSTGVTGVRTTFHDKLENLLNITGQVTLVPRAIGFGISDPETIKQLKDQTEGFIVGSALVKIIEEGINSGYLVEQIGNHIYDFIKTLRNALD